LQRVLEAQGVQFLFGRKALRVLLSGGQAVGVETMEGPLHADALVLAGGAAAVHLLRPLGIRLPIYPLRGYSLTLPVEPWHSSPRISITDAHHKIVYAPLQGRQVHQLRVAGMVDLAGENTSQPARRLATLARQAEAAFPAAADWSRAKSWAGLRPATPDGKPLIGASGIPGLWLNVGHGALGFTLAPATGQMLADMIDGEAPALDPAPFALARPATAQSVAATA
jgi:D-amino-acid dehydrogenase